jgi:hypothetical protein
MQALSAEGRRIVDEVAERHGFSTEAVTVLLNALVASDGSMAQFNHPEFGGMGQWSQGGMVMIGDMFNNALKQRVDVACNDIAQQIRGRLPFVDAPTPRPLQGQAQSQGGSHREQAAGYGHGGSGASLVIPAGGSSPGGWWPEDLGHPSSTGAQNNVRYASFPDRRRLALDIGGRITVYDTGDHQISGFSQQQSGDASLSFTSQHGLVRVADLAIVSPVHVAAPQHGAEGVFRPTPLPGATDTPPRRTGQYVDPPVLSPSAATAPPGGEDIFAAIERLAGLKQKGILSEEEFTAKKAELLARI